MNPLLYLKLAAMMALVAGTVYVTHGFDKGRYEALVASYKAAEATALQSALDEQKRLDAVAQAASEQEAVRQQHLAAHVRIQLAQVQKHVQALSHCLPLGVVRVLYAAGHGRLPDSMSYAAGQSDATCASDRWLELLSGLVQDYGTSRQNSEQLNALTRWWRATQK
jgi:hypothetical protein